MAQRCRRAHSEEAPQVERRGRLPEIAAIRRGNAASILSNVIDFIYFRDVNF